jgi:DNA methylase
VRWLRAARCVLKPDGTLWVTGTHHVIFDLGFALQSLGFRILNDLIWFKPNATPNALHTTFKHSKAVEPAPLAPRPRTRMMDAGCKRSWAESPREMCRPQWSGIIHGVKRPVGESQLRKEEKRVA